MRPPATAPCSATVYGKWHTEQEPLPTTPCSAALYREEATAHYPLYCKSILKDTCCPLPPTVKDTHPYSVAVCEAYPLPTTPYNAAGYPLLPASCSAAY